MKQYKDLDLRKVRDIMGLDFAHYTYLKGQCSCCHGPKDLPKIYWRGRVIPEHGEYTYLLFKNAYNGSGCVTKKDFIQDYTCVEWRFPVDKLDKVCEILQAQLGDEYVVQKPESDMYCILIRLKEKLNGL